MFGEGDLMRHMSQLSYRLLYTQDPLAEFDFSLVAMSADLKDGLRLCKLAEALTGDACSCCTAKCKPRTLNQCHTEHSHHLFCQNSTEAQPDCGHHKIDAH